MKIRLVVVVVVVGRVVVVVIGMFHILLFGLAGVGFDGPFKNYLQMEADAAVNQM